METLSNQRAVVLEQRILRRLFKLGRPETASQVRIIAAHFYSPDEFREALDQLSERGLLKATLRWRVDSLQLELTDEGKKQAEELITSLHRSTLSDLAKLITKEKA